MTKLSPALSATIFTTSPH